MKPTHVLNSILIVVSLLVVSCATADRSPNSQVSGVALFYAVAYMHPVEDAKTKVSGSIRFSEGFGRVVLHVDIQGLEANKKHGLNIHEFGDCLGQEAVNAGSHYNPTRVEHGSPDSVKHHAGDLGNLSTDEKGRVKTTFEIKGISINGHLNPIIGRSIIIHEYEDDGISQPDGASGTNISCGTIVAVGKL